MVALQIAVAVLCAGGTAWSCWSLLRRTGRFAAARELADGRSLRSARYSGVAGAIVLVVLLGVSGDLPSVVSDPLGVPGFGTPQYLAPAIAAVVALLGVPLVLRAPPAGRRVAALRPRTLGDVVARPAVSLLVPAIGALLVVGCALWQSTAQVEVLQTQLDSRGQHGVPETVSLRFFGLSPSVEQLAAIVAGVVLVTVAAWLGLRAIRDAPAVDDGGPGVDGAPLRRPLGAVVLAVATAAQSATAGLVLWTVGAFLQESESAPVMRLLRAEGPSTALYRRVGVERLEPAWALAAVEIGAGFALLLMAVGLAVHAVRLLSLRTVRPRPAEWTPAS